MCIRIITLALICFALSGCSTSSDEGSRGVQISPNGEWIAYLWYEREYVQRGPEPVPVRETVSLCWSATATPQKITCLPLGEWDPDQSAEFLSSQTHLVFSHKGRCLAIVQPGRLLFVDLVSGQTGIHELADEVTTSLSWLDEQTVGYVTYKKSGLGEDDKTERTFWRQRFDQSVAERTAIHCNVDIRYPLPTILDEGQDWPQEFWSPDGRFVLFRDPSRRGSPCLLKIVTQKVQGLQHSGALEAAAWRRDSSQVVYTVCTGYQAYQEFLLDISRGDLLDLTSQFRDVFQTSKPYLEPLWTPDGQFVVGSNLELGGYLIRPQPWSVNLIGKKLQGPGDTVGPWVRGQVVPGMLVARIAPNEAVVDYNGKILKVLTGTSWTVLPGGKQAISVQLGNKIAVASLE